DERDTMIVASVSGRNAAVIDMALEAKKVGMNVVVLTSVAFSNSVASRHSSGKLLKDVADIVIDLKCDLGDAALSLKGIDTKFAATSNVLGLAVMESMMARTIEINKAHDFDTPIYLSSNVNKGDEVNAKHLAKYRKLLSNL
ncbi:MAG: sugar isomerase domain-containing protein, partial [Alkalibacterium sp.]